MTKPEKPNLPGAEKTIWETLNDSFRRRRIGFHHFRPESDEQKRILLILYILSKKLFINRIHS
jgi:hypothetical protein